MEKRNKVFITLLTLGIIGYFAISYYQGKQTYTGAEVADIRRRIIEYELQKKDRYVLLEYQDGAVIDSLWWTGKGYNYHVDVYIDGSYVVINNWDATLIFHEAIDTNPSEKSGGLSRALELNLEIFLIYEILLPIGLFLFYNYKEKEKFQILTEEDFEDIEDEEE